jgi:hypothetical protein
MSLPGTIVLRPNEFSGQGYEMVYKDPDGRELTVGRIFRLAADERPWFWGVTSSQRRGRAAPHQGHGATLEEATAAWRNCWDSADVPIHWPPSMQNRRLG